MCAIHVAAAEAVQLVQEQDTARGDEAPADHLQEAPQSGAGVEVSPVEAAPAHVDQEAALVEAPAVFAADADGPGLQGRVDGAGLAGQAGARGLAAVG
jgi:hypothetical protein